MNLTRLQREELNSLSKLLFGTESKWTKLMNSPSFRIATDSSFTDKKSYMRLKNGSLMLTEKAITKPITRQPSYEEIRSYLYFLLDEKALSNLNHLQLSHVMAFKYANKDVSHLVSLIHNDDEQTNLKVDSLVNSLPGETKDFISKLLSERKEIKGINLDTLDFLTNLVFSVNHPEEAKKLHDDYINEGKAIYMQGQGLSKKRQKTESIVNDDMLSFKNKRSAKRVIAKIQQKEISKANNKSIAKSTVTHQKVGSA